jgi:hypothetical protein
VWEGRSRKAPPYPDHWHISHISMIDGMSAAGGSRHTRSGKHSLRMCGMLEKLFPGAPTAQLPLICFGLRPDALARLTP